MTIIEGFPFPKSTVHSPGPQESRRRHKSIAHGFLPRPEGHGREEGSTNALEVEVKMVEDRDHYPATQALAAYDITVSRINN